MALKVEDGTGGDALIDLDYLQQYCSDRGYDLTAFDEPKQEQAIRRASTYISNTFNYQGWKVGLRAQIQAWPRYDVEADGFPVDWQSIPREVQAATAEATWYELNNPNGLNPAIVLTDRVASETVGPISVTYVGSRGVGTNLNDSRPVLVILSELLGPLLSGTGANSVVGRANRG